MSYIKVDDLYKIASRRAILDRQSFLDSLGDCDPELSAQTVKQIEAFRLITKKPDVMTDELKEICFSMLMYAADYEFSLAESLGRSYPKEYTQATNLANAIQEYRFKHFGLSVLESKVKSMKSMSIFDIVEEMKNDESGKFTKCD